MNSKYLVAAMASLGLAGSAAHGDSIAYDNAAGITQPLGNPPYTPPGGIQNFGSNLGLDFTVNTPITVTALGAFDNGDITNLNGVAGGGVDVAIFNIAGSQVGPAVHFSLSNIGTGINGDAFLPVSISLGTGTYSIVAYNDFNFNSASFANTTSTLNSGGGAISFVGSGRYDYPIAGSLDFPTTVDGGPVNRYDAGTFSFAVPLPPAAGVEFSLLAGFGTLTALRKGLSRRIAIA